MRPGGQYVANAAPMIHFFGTGPQKRLSSEEPRLSPIMKYSSLGTVIGRGKLHSSPPVQGLMNFSVCSLPLRITCPSRIAIVSPGTPTTRLMKLTSERPFVGAAHARPGTGGTPH